MIIKDICFLSLTKMAQKGTIAYQRNILGIKSCLDTTSIDVLDSVFSIKRSIDKKIRYKKIVVVYSSRFFSDGSFEDIERFMNWNENSDIYWMINEYNLVPNSTFARIFKERGFTLICNHERSDKLSEPLRNAIKERHMINLNVFAYRAGIKKAEKTRDCIYYGTFRPDRVKYFKKYLDNSSIYVSTTIKNIPKWRAAGISPARVIDKLEWGNVPQLGSYKASLYIEDEHTHTNFNFLADRFYEALSCDVQLLFDRSCLNTIRKSFYEESLFVLVDSVEDVERVCEANQRDTKTLVAEYLKERAEVEREINSILIP